MAEDPGKEKKGFAGLSSLTSDRGEQDTKAMGRPDTPGPMPSQPAESGKSEPSKEPFRLSPLPQEEATGGGANQKSEVWVLFLAIASVCLMILVAVIWNLNPYRMEVTFLPDLRPDVSSIPPIRYESSPTPRPNLQVIIPTPTPQPIWTLTATPSPTVTATSTPVVWRVNGNESVLALTGAMTMEFVKVPAGSFMMGSPENEIGRSDHEGPLHSVTISHSFWIGKYEVTNQQFDAFIRATGYSMRAGSTKGGLGIEWRDLNEAPVFSEDADWRNPGWDIEELQPVVLVSWHDAKAYCHWLQNLTGMAFDLPSEAQWEYACRGGTNTSRYWGESPEDACEYENVFGGDTAPEGLDLHRCSDDYFLCPAPVGAFRPNGFGLFDMIGNVREWCNDYYGSDYYSLSPAVDPSGPLWGEPITPILGGAEGGPLGEIMARYFNERTRIGPARVIRGGAAFDLVQYCRSASRGRLTPNFQIFTVGFRVVLNKSDSIGQMESHRSLSSKTPDPGITAKAQGLLSSLGYDPGPSDGKYGSQTEAAVKRFQEDNGLSQDGWIDEPLLLALERRKASRVSVTATPSPRSNSGGGKSGSKENSNKEYLTRGSHKDDVLRIQGMPSSVDAFPDWEVWYYGTSTLKISKENQRLAEWDNIDGNLNVRLLPGLNITGAAYFKRGSHMDDVLRLQGTPKSIYRFSDHEVWTYEYSTVEFSNRTQSVTKWKNTSNNLKVK